MKYIQPHTHIYMYIFPLKLSMRIEEAAHTIMCSGISSLYLMKSLFKVHQNWLLSYFS